MELYGGEQAYRGPALFVVWEFVFDSSAQVCTEILFYYQVIEKYT